MLTLTRSLIRTDPDIDHNENQIQEQTNICDVSISVASSNPNISVTGKCNKGCLKKTATFYIIYSRYNHNNDILRILS